MSLGAVTSFGRYRLLREIGRGGEAIVHLAEDPALKRKVALKIFPRTVAAGPAEPPPGFRHEVEVLSRLRHPGICTVHDAGIEDGSAFIAMSYVEGRTLADHARLGSEEAIRLGEEIAAIVTAAHEISIVHGDLKPANILVTPEGRCVVLDFGIARLLDDGPPLPRANRLAGTLPYLAPECLVQPPDVRSDVYGLGAVLFELVSGRPLRSGPTRAALLELVAKTDPPLLRAVAGDAPRDLEAVLAKALDREPTRRYATMAGLSADLARLRRGEPASARPLGPVGRAVRWARRHRAAAVLAAFGFLFLAVAASVTAIKNRDLARHLERAREAETRAAGAARAAQEHLVRFERLSDRRRISDLEARANAMMRPRPDVVPALGAWLADAEPLARRLQDHRDALAEVRSRGGPAEPPPSPPLASLAAGSPRPTSAGILPTPLAQEILDLEARHARLLASHDPQPSEAQLRGLIQRLESSLPPAGRMAYTSPGDAWQDETLAALIAELERFIDPDPLRGTMAAVARRIEYVRRLEKSLAANEAAWDRALRSIANERECPRYAGLAIKPQLGLVPLRRDPVSGLWEFLHVLSGEAPRESPEGRLEMTPESGIVLVLLPGGASRMGARRPAPDDPPDAPHVDPLAEPEESPVVNVRIDPFFISKFEMTRSQWARESSRSPSVQAGRTLDPLLPIFGIDWNETAAALERLDLDLPTEAQWEYAARAGTTTPWWTGSDPASLSGAAVFSPAPSQPVGARRPNAFGLHDVAGNVAEWCRDAFVRYGEALAPGSGQAPDALRPQTFRVTRGGSSGLAPTGLRTSLRRPAEPTGRPADTGVRPSRRLDR